MDKRLLCGAVIAVVASLTVTMAAKPPKLQAVLATSTFRCMALALSNPTACGTISNVTDRIRDDTAPSYVGTIWTSGMYSLNLTSTGRTLNLTLGKAIGRDQDPPVPITCENAGNCNPDHSFLEDQHVALDNGGFELKPLTPGPEFADLPGLLWGMSCLGSYPGLVNYTFELPDGIGALKTGHWGFNFNERAYGGTTNAVITRAGKLHWSVVSNAFTNPSIGELLSWEHTGLLRPHTGPSHEGFYYANFAFTIVASALPAPGAGVGEGCAID